MYCPKCGHDDSKVVDSRASGVGIRRRRQCLKCDNRFSTNERVERKMPLLVKKDGSRVTFDIDKIAAGLRLACRKRPVSATQMESAAVSIEQALLESAKNEVHAADVGREVMAQLKKLDLVAYVRFASVYLEVETPDDFLELLQPWVEGSSGENGTSK